jgi:hypothetical protein
MSGFAVHFAKFYDEIRHFSTPHCTGFTRSDPQEKSGTWGETPTLSRIAKL